MIRTLLITILALGLISPFSAGEIIRLKNGVELQCEILDCSEENGLKVKRLDNGGVFDLRWEHILDADVKAIKYARGYTDEEAQPVLIRATRVWLRNGTFEDGIKMESDKPGTLNLRRHGKVYPIMQNQVKDIENVELEAREVYTLDELYQQKMEEGAPETVHEFFAMGVYLESVTYYEKALQYYENIIDFDPNYKPDVLAQKTRLMADKIHEADATHLLDEIKKLAYRNKFALALQRLLEFEETFPDSRQMGYKEKLKSEILVRRRQYYQVKIIPDYFSYMDKVANKVASNKEFTLEDVLDYAVEQMGPDIRTRLADVYKIELAEVEDLWLNRKGGSPRRNSYGTGTFILGPDRAKEIPKIEGDDDKEVVEEVEKPTSLDERLKKRIEELKKQKDQNKGKRKGKFRIEDVGRNPEQWWAGESVANRKRFLMCYYAEESGDLKIKGVYLYPCPHCNGKGWLEQISTTGEEDQKLPCEVCKTLAVERTVIYK